MRRLAPVLVCVLVSLLMLPALLPRVAAERAVAPSASPVELAVPDSVLQTWDSPAEQLESAGVSTVVLGMRYTDDVPVGYDAQRLEALRAAGFRVVLALPEVTPPRTVGWLETQVTRAVSATDARMVVSLGDPLPAGFAPYLREHGLLLALPDLGTPERADTYAEALPGQVVRAHFLALGPSSDLSSLDVRAHRAEKERGVRFLSIQPPRPEVPVGLDRVASLAREIGARQRTGPAVPMPAVDPAFPFGWLSPTLVQLLALGAGIAGATLAILLVMRGLGGWLRRFGLAALVTVTTGLVIAALGSRSAFLVGAERFVGVKLLLLAPPMLVALAGLWVNRRRLKTVRWSPWYALAGVLALLAGAYYLLRSGNSGVAPGLELRLRDVLDELLYSRPRFKEALLGYPALVLAVGLRSSWRWVFAVLAAVGTAGTVDTFAHFHTPLWVSLLRTGYAVVIGLVLGLVVLAVWRSVERRRGAAS